MLVMFILYMPAILSFEKKWEIANLPKLYMNLLIVLSDLYHVNKTHLK
ncbi:Uncharacterised protein [Sphingobacterium daejeonense]|nr:Uncharacterised protein [Sphingobacterium daejeonense]